MSTIRTFLLKRAEDVQVFLMVVMFVAFIIQIGSRYLFNAPTDWTYELILVTWLWSVFWGAAFLLRDEDQVKFDIFYNMANRRGQLRLSALSAAFLLIGFAVSLPGTWDFVSFKGIRSTDVLHIRFDYLFSVYLVFLIATLFRYARRLWACWQALRDDAPQGSTQP